MQYYFRFHDMFRMMASVLRHAIHGFLDLGMIRHASVYSFRYIENHFYIKIFINLTFENFNFYLFVQIISYYLLSLLI